MNKCNGFFLGDNGDEDDRDAFVDCCCDPPPRGEETAEDDDDDDLP